VHAGVLDQPVSIEGSYSTLLAMKIVLATPLYPPDIAEPAPYIKELAKRLSKQHEVTILAYGSYPEKVDGVRIFTVSKRRSRPVRIIQYTLALFIATLRADVVVAENGPSTEVPVGLVARLTKKPLIVHIGDRDAHARAAKDTRLQRFERFVLSQAKSVILDMPLPRPEIFPFENFPTSAMSMYESSWDEHLKKLEQQLAYVR